MPSFSPALRAVTPRLLTLSSPEIDVVLDTFSRTLSVRDKRCGKTWRQSPWSRTWEIEQAENEGERITLKFSNGFGSVLELGERAELVVTLTGAPELEMGQTRFPGAFETPDTQHYLLQTDSQGLLLPVDDTVYTLGGELTYYCGGGGVMAWTGIVDHDFKTGYMAILDHPFDASLETRRENGLITFGPLWFASKGRLVYDRRVRYVFFDEGGYVAQCKRYRRYIWPKNKVRTLRENQARFPAIAKILGAVHIYVWDKAREVAFARELKDAGVERAMILWNPNHAPYPSPGYSEQMKELGYATGAYELFSDIHPPSSPRSEFVPGLPLKRNIYPGRFDELAARTVDGGTYSNKFAHYICPAAIQGEMIKRVDQEMAVYPHETYFVDVYHANGPYECYHPEHPLTRTGYAEAIIKNLELLEDRYKVFVGGEWGGDFTGSHCIFAHGTMTLQRMWFDSEINHEGTIHYYGDWKNNSRPSIMLGTRTAGESYLRYGINEYTRVPLYELVYHDAVVTSWRWEDGNHHCPEIWWKKDLFNILYGSAPMWSIDQELWARFRSTFVESYRNICPWLEQICYDEMLSHRFVSPDRKVQETRFSSGKRAVVNFGDTPFPFEGTTVPARGHVVR